MMQIWANSATISDLDPSLSLSHIYCLSTLTECLSSSFIFLEIEKIQKDEGKEEEKFIDVVINKNMKLGQKVLIPVKQFPKVSATVLPPETSPKMWSAQTENFRWCYL